jgi:tryptophan-rich sensory protein
MPRGEEKLKPDTGFLGFLVSVYVVAFLGYLGLRRGVGSWYVGLVHPTASLPPWAFGPIFAFICLLLGYVAWQIWGVQKSKARGWALGLFSGQVALHSLWLWLLFGMQKPFGALIVLGSLGLVAIGSYVAGHRVRPITAVLVTPFLVWLFYAGFLTYGIWSLNYRNSAGVGHIETTITPM